jgi:hypothetical protein
MDEINKVYNKIDEVFELKIDKQLLGSGYTFVSFHEIRDLVNDSNSYTVTIENTDLNFKDRAGFLEVLLKFIDRELEQIPIEYGNLERERAHRDFNDYRHFDVTEALSQKEAKLTKMKSKLMKLSKQNNQ